MTPESTKKFVKDGHEVIFETGAGVAASFPDQAYIDAGANLASKADLLTSVDVLAAIDPPATEDLRQLKSGSWVVALFNPLVNKEQVEEVRQLDIKAFSMDRIPRTSLAQSMDVLSSMASIAGYKAVLLGADHLPRYMPMLMTSAGTIPPAKVLVLGAGVAGLQAIATARRLGGTVEAFDVRSAVKEEVQSLGAKFVEVEGATEDKGAGGYAVEQSEDYKRRQSELIQERAKAADLIITTANIPGRTAPRLINADTVDNMRPGAVIIDLASESGGNCELTQPGKTIVHNGVTIIGQDKIPASMPDHASKLFGNNLYNFLKFLLKNGWEEVDFSHEIPQATSLNDILEKA